MTEVEVGRGRAYRPRPGPLISLHKHQQTAEAHLVEVALKQPTQIVVVRLGIMPTRHAAHPWHRHPEEAIALAILPRAGLEEARQVGRLSDRSEGLQFAQYLVRDHGSSFQISSSTARFGMVHARGIAPIAVIAVGRHRLDDDGLSRPSDGQHGAHLEIIRQSEVGLNLFGIKGLDDAPAQAALGEREQDGEGLDAVVAVGIADDARIEELDEVCRGSFSLGRSAPVFEVGCPAERGEEPIALVALGDEAVLQRLSVARRRAESCGINGRGEHVGVEAFVLVKAPEAPGL